MHIGYIGLGKMGLQMAIGLVEKGHTVVGYNKSDAPYQEARAGGVVIAESYDDLVSQTLPSLDGSRVFWLMVPHTAVDAVLDELLPRVNKGDIVIDSANSHWKDSVKRAKRCGEKGISFMDAGFSGGPEGARTGGCVMVGGEKEVFARLSPLFSDVAKNQGFGYMGKSGAGHFVKMTHNGIEYGMMQALAEGFALMRASDFDIDLTEVARVYGSGSVIDSRLVHWLHKGYEKYGEDLADASTTVGHTGMGAWTIEAGRDVGVPTPVIEASLEVRKKSPEKETYTARVLSLLRHMFGGHEL